MQRDSQSREAKKQAQNEITKGNSRKKELNETEAIYQIKNSK